MPTAMHECAVGQDTQNSWPVGTRGFGLGVIDQPRGALAGAAEAPIRMIAAAATAAAATRRAMHGSIPDGRGRCFPAGLIGCCRDGVASPPFLELIPRMMDPQARRIRRGQSYARDLTKSSHRRPGRVSAGCRHAPGCHVIGGHRCAGHSEHITTLRVQR